VQLFIALGVGWCRAALHWVSTGQAKKMEWQKLLQIKHTPACELPTLSSLLQETWQWVQIDPDLLLLQLEQQQWDVPDLFLKLVLYCEELSIHEFEVYGSLIRQRIPVLLPMMPAFFTQYQKHGCMPLFPAIAGGSSGNPAQT
jgi:hypothetical protein